MPSEDGDAGQTVLIGNDGGFGLPEARTYERDDGSMATIPPDGVFITPLRTTANGWQKYHAKRGCGARSVRYVENTATPQRTTDRYDWKLYCYDCGHLISWDEVLYISEEWFYSRDSAFGHQLFDNLHLSEEQVLELGPDPMEAELVDAIQTAFNEREESLERHREVFRKHGILGGGAE